MSSEIVVMAEVNDLRQIISVFLQRCVLELSDAALCSDLDTNDDHLSTERLRRIVESQGSTLFQLHFNEDHTFSVRLEPTVGANTVIVLVNVLSLSLVR